MLQILGRYLMQLETMRYLKEPEQLMEFKGHKGECRYCEDGLVKMGRNRETFDLEPNNCFCLLCGQRYYYVYPEKTLEELDMRLWEEKAEGYALETKT